MIRYLLTVLTNGRPDYLERSVAAFIEHVRPHPSRVAVVDDGGKTGYDRVSAALAPLGVPVVYTATPVPVGMCAAHALCWEAAAGTKDLPHVFHLEDDYVTLRPVDLDPIATCMAARPRLAQMALVRCPWGAEIEHGGYIPQAPSWYERTERKVGHLRYEWIEQDRNWTATPALFRTDVARAVPWSTEPGCETEIGPTLTVLRPGTRFGLWGWGEPWVAHIGVHRAPGARGY